MACAHAWTDDGEFLLVCTACGSQEDYNQALQLAFELGGTDDGAYHLEADELVQVIQRYAEQPAPVAVDVLGTGFYTTESGGGKYAINIGFRSMADMQAADAQLRELLKSR